MPSKRKYCRKDEPPTLVCEQCGNEFHPLLKDYGGKNHGFYYEQRFCSKSCANLSRGGNKGTIHHTGYRYISMGKRGSVRAEHHVVMEKILGRPLRKDETVHHKNGQRADNRPENLELWSGRHGKGHRVADQVQFAKDTLAIYGEGPFDQSFIEQGRKDVQLALASLSLGR